MQHERLLKVLVIGDLGVGKTSIIKRYVHQIFSQHYRATIGVDFALKVLNWDHKTIVRLQLWDIAGQERYGNMTRVYYREAVGALVIFDMTRASTFQAVLKWKGDLDSKVALGNGRPDNTNIDAAIMCLVESIMAVEEERPPGGDPRDPSVLVLPRFDYNMKDRTGMAGLSGCDGCKKRPLPGRREMGDI
ncbi:unnamed protein product [Coregonus sp. 'balchen']|nr:unnamed protein product [Coregonus sp. 'balchen']